MNNITVLNKIFYFFGFCLILQSCTTEKITQYKCTTYLGSAVYSTKIVSDCSVCIAPKGYSTSCKQISMTMTNNTKKKIIKITSLLSDEQRKQEIIEIENNDSNRHIIKYLESIGKGDVFYKVSNDSQTTYMTEDSGLYNLWYRKSDGNWIINLWKINQLLI